MSNKPVKTNQNSATLGRINSVITKSLNKSLNDLELPRLYNQLVIFLLDGSGSMTFNGITGVSKSKEIETTVKLVLKRLTQSKNNNSFDIAIWGFAEESVQILGVTPLKEIDLGASMDSCNFINLNRATCLKETLSNTKKQALDYISQNLDRNTQVLLIILSDGEVHDQDESEVICNQLKLNKKISISSIFFESEEEDTMNIDNNECRANLQKLASNISFFHTSCDPDTIRNHMIKSITTVGKFIS